MSSTEIAVVENKAAELTEAAGKVTEAAPLTDRERHFALLRKTAANARTANTLFRLTILATSKLYGSAVIAEVLADVAPEGPEAFGL